MTPTPDDLIAENDRLRAVVAALAAELQRLEWSARDTHFVDLKFCPACMSGHRNHVGHLPGCTLAAALALAARDVPH